MSASVILFSPVTSPATIIKKITPLDYEGKLSSPSDFFTYFTKANDIAIENYSETRSMVQKGETLVELLKPHGLTHAAIFELAKASKDIFNVKKIRYGRWYSVIRDRNDNNRIKYFIYEENSVNYVVFDFGDSIKVHTAHKDIKLKTRQVEGTIQTSLYDTALQLKLNANLTEELKKIFSNTLNLDTLHKGDKIQLAYQEKTILNKPVGTGHITAAVITTNARRYHAYRFTCNGKTGYYDEKGWSLEPSFLKTPLKYRRISSEFSLCRLHPIKKVFKSHPGIDFAAPTGTPVKSVGDGTVIFKGYSKSSGNYIKIKHPGTGISEYLHFSRFHPSMRLNKKISKGDIIGYVGSTGYATGPHLDLRFMVNGRYVDYRKLKLPNGDPIPKKEIPMFINQIALVNSKWKQNRTNVSLNTMHDSAAKDGFNIKHDSTSKDASNIKHGSTAKDGFNTKHGSTAKDGFNIKHDSTAKDGFNIKHDSAKKAGFNIKHRSVPANPADSIIMDSLPAASMPRKAGSNSSDKLASGR